MTVFSKAMDGASSLTEIEQAAMDMSLPTIGIVNDDALFTSLLAGDMDSVTAEMSPVQLVTEFAAPAAVLAYGVRKGSFGSGALEVLQAAEDIIGVRVDFSG